MTLRGLRSGCLAARGAFLGLRLLAARRRRDERLELLREHARVVAGLDREHGLEQHRAVALLVRRELLEPVRDREEEDVRAADAVERREEGARDRVPEVRRV